MDEYIEREAAIREFDTYGSRYVYGLKTSRAIQSRLRMIPAADVRPVVRGAWQTGNNNPRTYGRIRAMCGRCGAFALYEMVNAGSFKEKTTNFCPNCGAMMEGDEA